VQKAAAQKGGRKGFQLNGRGGKRTGIQNGGQKGNKKKEAITKKKEKKRKKKKKKHLGRHVGHGRGGIAAIEKKTCEDAEGGRVS